MRTGVEMAAGTVGGLKNSSGPGGCRRQGSDYPGAQTTLILSHDSHSRAQRPPDGPCRRVSEYEEMSGAFVSQ